MQHKHILICGPRGVGKSTLIEALIRRCPVPVYGFVTRSTARNADGFHSIYIHAASDPVRQQTSENHIGDCNGRTRTVHPEVFETLGVSLLRAKPDGVIFMDELGFMESEAHVFQAAVLRCLDADTPVIAGVKARDDVAFLNTVRAHPNAVCYFMTAENRNRLYQELSEILKDWTSTHL